VTPAKRVLGVTVIFGFAAGIAYWLYLYISSGSAPSFGDLWGVFQGGVSMTTGIGKLSVAEITSYASNAGFEGDDLNTAVAIALAESSGNPNTVGDLTITAGGSVGLWQVNLHYHPEYTADALKDPQTNANAAYAIYQAAGGFTPWSTFNKGAFAKYLPVGSTPATEVTSNPVNGTGDLSLAVDDATGFGSDTSGGTVGGT
jgi:hypothetical protein